MEFLMYSLAELIERLSQSMQDHEDSVTKKSEFANLSVTQIHYLDAIRHFDEPPMISHLAKYLKVAKPTVTNAIERLEQEGYVRKVPSSEDRRMWYVHLTTKGLRISDLHDQIHLGYAKNFEKALNSDELDRLVALLNKVIQPLGL
jgi:DNA-binding MarR family transcriptional regulator